jgi:hypothetical protein
LEGGLSGDVVVKEGDDLRLLSTRGYVEEAMSSESTVTSPGVDCSMRYQLKFFDDEKGRQGRGNLWFIRLLTVVRIAVRSRNTRSVSISP